MLYFYPKDNTAGCTLEAQGFRDYLADFEALGYAVAGVSRDSVKSHCGFRDRQNLNFPLLADKEEVVCTAYGRHEGEDDVRQALPRASNAPRS